MIPDDVTGRIVADWFHADAPDRIPDHVGTILERAGTERQRPAWMHPGRWLPVDLTFWTPPFSYARAGRLLVVALLLLVIAGLAILAVGSRPAPLPAPFGLARNGDVIATRDGDIYAIDPTTRAERLLIGDAGFDLAVDVSRDGTKLVFLRTAAAPLSEVTAFTVMVADIDGSDVRAVSGPLEHVTWFDWSPDGQRVAMIQRGMPYVVDLLTGRSTGLETGALADFVQWLPPDGADIVFRRETNEPGIWAIGADGTNLRRLSIQRPLDSHDYQELAVSPDGRLVGFTRWTSVDTPSVHELDIETGAERAYPAAIGVGQRGLVYSPDGARVAYALLRYDGTVQAAVASAGGSGDERRLGPEIPALASGRRVDLTLAFVPDGSAVIARYDDLMSVTTRILPIDGSEGHEVPSGQFGFVDMQRLGG
jgi:dipeptidyl aminopeptidase/acylaminoacyl peptidase